MIVPMWHVVAAMFAGVLIGGCMGVAVMAAYRVPEPCICDCNGPRLSK